eukprot:gene9511-9675_t
MPTPTQIQEDAGFVTAVPVNAPVAIPIAVPVAIPVPQPLAFAPTIEHTGTSVSCSTACCLPVTRQAHVRTVCERLTNKQYRKLYKRKNLGLFKEAIDGCDLDTWVDSNDCYLLGQGGMGFAVQGLIPWPAATKNKIQQQFGNCPELLEGLPVVAKIITIPAPDRGDDLFVEALSRAQDEADASLAEVHCQVNHAHSVGFTHNDLKPANIVWTGSRPYVIDWGLAGRLNSPASIAGTKEFIAATHFKSLLAGNSTYGQDDDIADLGRIAVYLVGQGDWALYQKVCAIDRWVQQVDASGSSTGAFPPQHMLRALLRGRPGATVGVLDLVCMALGPASARPTTLEGWYASYQAAGQQGSLQELDRPAAGEVDWLQQWQPEVQRQQGLLKLDYFRFVHNFTVGRMLDLGKAQDTSLFYDSEGAPSEDKEEWSEPLEGLRQVVEGEGVVGSAWWFIDSWGETGVDR